MSKKCCYLCDQLHKRLFDGDSLPMGYTTLNLLTLSQDSVRVCLPDTHGRIFPWDPPRFGVPPAVLNWLANDLKEQFVKLAQKEASKSIPQLRSSPSDDEKDGGLLTPEDLAYSVKRGKPRADRW